MLHAHTHPASAVKAIVDECNNTGEELPTWITQAPVLRFGLALYYNAWFELDLERRRVRLQPITRSSVFDYCDDYELTELQTEDMWFYISRMDNKFLDWYATQIKEPDRGDASRPFRPLPKGRG